jgi:hypothetical protein
MKKWAYYDELKEELELDRLKVNILQRQPTWLEHLADVQGHRCLVCSDSLPMHLALGSGVRCVSILPARVHGKYTGTDRRKNCLSSFGKIFL